jgi:hypothetical protein
MADIIVDRSGDRPLAFQGKEWSNASSCMDVKPGSVRWHEITVYKLEREAGGYVVAVSYRTEWDTETDHNAAKVCANAEEVATYLREYDPLAWFIGPPEGAASNPEEQCTRRERRDRLSRDLKLRYEDVVSEALEKLEPERVE